MDRTEVDKSNPAYKHGHAGSKKFSPEYQSWACAIQRCTNEKRASYMYYGGRGIKICDRWRTSFENFLVDMGPRPDGTSLDRLDPDGNYEPSNCQWGTALDQAKNKRHVPRVTDNYRQRVYDLVSAGTHLLPDIVRVMGLHDEVVKKEVRKLVRSGQLKSTRVPTGNRVGRTLFLEVM